MARDSVRDGGLVVVAAIILANLLLPRPTLEALASRPWIVLPVWILTMLTLFWRWWKERRLITA